MLGKTVKSNKSQECSTVVHSALQLLSEAERLAKSGHRKSDLNSNEHAILTKLCCYMGKKYVAWPTINTLGHDLDMKERTLYRYLSSLIQKGYIKKSKMPIRKTQCNLYELTDKLQKEIDQAKQIKHEAYLDKKVTECGTECIMWSSDEIEPIETYDSIVQKEVIKKVRLNCSNIYEYLPNRQPNINTNVLSIKRTLRESTSRLETSTDSENMCVKKDLPYLGQPELQKNSPDGINVVQSNEFHTKEMGKMEKSVESLGLQTKFKAKCPASNRNYSRNSAKKSSITDSFEKLQCNHGNGGNENKNQANLKKSLRDFTPNEAHHQLAKDKHIDLALLLAKFIAWNIKVDRCPWNIDEAFTSWIMRERISKSHTSTSRFRASSDKPDKPTGYANVQNQSTSHGAYEDPRYEKPVDRAIGCNYLDEIMKKFPNFKSSWRK